MARFGPNALPASPGTGLLTRVLRQLHHPLIYVLLAAGVITAVLGEYTDSAVIFGVVLVNAIVGFIQESKAEAALEGLRSMVRTQASVIRDGEERTVPSGDLVPGDLILLEAGDKVPADVRLMRLTELRVDESALTGESAPWPRTGTCYPQRFRWPTGATWLTQAPWSPRATGPGSWSRPARRPSWVRSTASWEPRKRSRPL
ncbi:HAD-IC family P-type ATPase [Saccharopolyspora spinosporotrichia]